MNRLASVVISSREDGAAAHLDRPGGKVIPRTGSGDAVAIKAEQRAMACAEDVAGIAGQVAVVHRGQRPARVRATVDEPARGLALADHEAREQP